MEDHVDILLATCNGKKYLPELIKSILDQTHKNFRIIIRDDGSTDGTYALLEAFAKEDERITILPAAGKLGAKGNFSRLMEHASADYIFFADQDDVWKPEKIYLLLTRMKEMECLHGRRMPLLVHSDMVVVDSELKVLDHSFWHYSRLNPYQMRSLNKLLVQNVVTGCAMLINRPLLETASSIPDKAIMHDWWLALVAAAFGRIGVEDSPTILYRQHGQNTLGAQKFASWRSLKRGIAYILHGSSTKRDQAEQFYQRYQPMLDDKQRRMLEVFLTLPEYSYLKSRYLMMRHCFFKSGFLRNIALFIAKSPP
jgi:glycosyltransferase involved in cell wall biosynthesis